MNQCTGNCNCCPCLSIPTSIVSKGGTTTITLPDGTITGLCNNEKFCILLRASIPVESECNTIKVTDGTTTLDVCKNCQYWRPCKLQCRSVLVMRYLSDPAVAVIENVKGRCAK